MSNFAPIEILTFDCYGTLIDWETGILNAIHPVLSAHHIKVADLGILESYAAFEAEEERRNYRPYREILRAIIRRFGEKYSFRPAENELTALADSVPLWRPFADTIPTLQKLRQKYRLTVLSNIDDELIAGSLSQLGVDFDEIITAQQARAYKPDPAFFDLALTRIGLSIDRILHCAQSLYHDIAPARKFGISSVWINRRIDQQGSGATPVCVAKADFEVLNLSGLVALLQDQNG